MLRLRDGGKVLGVNAAESERSGPCARGFPEDSIENSAKGLSTGPAQHMPVNTDCSFCDLLL